MNKKIIISATDETVRKLKTLSKKKKGIKGRMMVTVKKLSSKARRLAVTKERNDLYKNKKTVISATDNTILKLKVLAKKKEGVRGKLAVIAKKLVMIAKEKESVRHKLEITAKKLAVTAKEKETVRSKLAVTAETLRLKAKQLAVIAKEKESIKDRLEITAKQLVMAAKEKETVRRNLEVTAKNLAKLAKEKENIKDRLEITAEKAKRAEELVIANKELAVQNTLKEKKAVALIVANKKLIIANKLKAKRATELVIANKLKTKRATELVIANKKLIFENKEKAKRAEELVIEHKKLEKLKDDYLSITIHELKTPLVPIKSQAQLLLAGDYGELNEEQKNAIEMIYRNEENLINLTAQILDVAKIRSNRFELLLESTVLSEIIIDATKDMESIFKLKHITFTLLPIPYLPKIMADKFRLKQVIGNLLSNAFKFTEEGGKINLEVKKIANNIVVIVKDTGIGIKSKNLLKLFTTFFQIDSNLNRKYRGTGLGLVICKGIVEAHGGKIWVESEGEGKGSTFGFSLPIKKI